MTQQEQRTYLIKELLREQPEYQNMDIPKETQAQKDLLRALMNVRPPREISEQFLRIQDAYLRRALEERGIVDIHDLVPVRDGLYLYQGDITTLRVDAIVNAANSGMTGCYQPLHSCIDNCIHTYAGVQLRRRCEEIMAEQGYPEPTGQAKITPGCNLPCKYILHTVGPIVEGKLKAEHEAQLASCYRSCLELAAENHVKSIAFCCISTGVFRFPNRRAAEIAVETVTDWQAAHSHTVERVVFNVFKDADRAIYEALLRP